MGLRARLFTGTTALVLALVAVQWWLQSRQLTAIQRELAVVAGSVGEGLVLHGVAGDGAPITLRGAAEAAVAGPPQADEGREPTLSLPTPSSASEGTVERSIRVERIGDTEMHWVTVTGAPDPEATPGAVVFFHKVLVPERGDHEEGTATWHASADGHVRYGVVLHGDNATITTDTTPQEARTAPGVIELKVVGEDRGRRNVLIVNDDRGGERRVEIPTEHAERLVRVTLRKGVLASAGLLALGILGAAVVSHRVTQPVRSLAQGVEAIGQGGFGTRVEVTGRGEIGDLQRRFNTMSERLADLERQKQEWAAREHLAELGALARGLGHTVRNPLNTLGLVVEELAVRGDSEDTRLVGTARAQIRRIDRWLVSFLALGAGRAARPERLDANHVAGSLVLEATQAGATVSFAPSPSPASVDAVPEALRAAVSNLIDNAVEAAPAGTPVEVAVEVGDVVSITVRDHGPGVPEEVRRQLFTPHVTTKSGGSGMGLFLARQLVEAGHGGTLELLDASDGGTVARIRLPFADDTRGEPA